MIFPGISEDEPGSLLELPAHSCAGRLPLSAKLVAEHLEMEERLDAMTLPEQREFLQGDPHAARLALDLVLSQAQAQGHALRSLHRKGNSTLGTRSHAALRGGVLRTMDSTAQLLEAIPQSMLGDRPAAPFRVGNAIALQPQSPRGVREDDFTLLARSDLSNARGQLSLEGILLGNREEQLLGAVSGGSNDPTAHGGEHGGEPGTWGRGAAMQRHGELYRAWVWRRALLGEPCRPLGNVIPLDSGYRSMEHPWAHAFPAGIMETPAGQIPVIVERTHDAGLWQNGVPEAVRLRALYTAWVMGAPGARVRAQVLEGEVRDYALDAQEPLQRDHMPITMEQYAMERLEPWWGSLEQRSQS